MTRASYSKVDRPTGLLATSKSFYASFSEGSELLAEETII